jgi:hypothetical protein
MTGLNNADQYNHSLTLSSCHQGAGIEGLCLGGPIASPPLAPYYHNVLSPAVPGANNTDGTLCYDLPIAQGPVPSTMRLFTSVTSNVAFPILLPGWSDPSTVMFEEGGSMYIPTSFDDTVSPAVYLQSPLHLKKWYICLATWAYTYNSLICTIGIKSEPQNPACQYVEVIRVFA